MSSNALDDKLRTLLMRQLQESRRTTDYLFQLLKPEAIFDRPIRERHRIIFYLGHLEVFDWNLIGRQTFQMDPFNEYFDELFAFGIDPLDGKVPTDMPSDWPPVKDIDVYRERSRNTIDRLLECTSFDDSLGEGLSDGLVFHLASEHRLMHAETLAWMYHWLPLDRKQPQTESPRPADPKIKPYLIEIPKGQATLGTNLQGVFGWDNETNISIVDVPPFRIDAYNVTNEQYLSFVQEGGYEDRSLWKTEDWAWIKTENIRHPRFWKQKNGKWIQRNMFDERPLQRSWPVYVSHAEASAYARWTNMVLPTEAQIHRAAYGTPDGIEQPFPWGVKPPEYWHGNFNFTRWDPTPVGSYPDGNSAFGVADILGNGWEWTSTLFAPFEGFKPSPLYPGYSADFFDGKHYVIKGASPRTARRMLRRSFRNWFQPHYPYIYCSFRCVET